MNSSSSGLLKSWFQNWTKNPDPGSELAEQRSHQWRRFSRDPFEPAEPKRTTLAPVALKKVFSDGLDSTIVEIPRTGQAPVMDCSNDSQNKADFEFTEFTEQKPKLEHPGPSWVHLFYDLAWTASFASLTQNGKFDELKDYISYYFFFAAVMWLWASQTLYSIHFYTNDWFHLTTTFLQLFVFGMIAATTLGTGYDIGNYISHSPGTNELDPKSINDIDDPQRYFGEKTASLSAIVLALAFAITRIIHLVQYGRVLWYARGAAINSSKRITCPQSREQVEVQECPDFEADSRAHGRHWITHIPPQLMAVTVGLLISNPMFLAAFGVATSEFDKTVAGASLRLGLWIGGFQVEVLSHFTVPYYYWRNTQPGNSQRNGQRLESDMGHKRNSGVPLWCQLPVAPGMDLCGRLQTVTTIILGEGINGIAGTFTSFLKAPTTEVALKILVPCTALIIWFIAYTYFEGPRGNKTPKITSLRYMLWLTLHLPFLASTVLLLVGIKIQFFLTSFLSSFSTSVNEFNEILSKELLESHNATYWRTNPTMKHFLLERGMVWKDEFNEFFNTTAYAGDSRTAEGQGLTMPVWSLRLAFRFCLNSFKDFSGPGNSIPREIQSKIDTYEQDFKQIAEDLQNFGDAQKASFYQIISQLIEGPLWSTRCIVAFAGLILISLSLQDFIHSWPQDRYQWGVITSRFLMGAVLCLLLLLNIGEFQRLFVPLEDMNRRAGVFLWMEAMWVTPTIAIAYGVQFLIEIVLARFAKRATEKALLSTGASGNSQETFEACKKSA